MPKLMVSTGLLCILVMGCGGSNTLPTPDQEQENGLREVGEMYRNYQMAKNRPPEKFIDFTSVRAVAGNGYEFVKSVPWLDEHGESVSIIEKTIYVATKEAHRLRQEQKRVS